MPQIFEVTSEVLKIPEGKNLVLLRHAKSLHNKPDNIARFAGAKVNSRITPEGAVETKKLAKEISKKIQPQLIVHSDLIRTKETAESLRQGFWGQDPNLIIEMDEIKFIREVDVGDFTGLTEMEARDRYPDAADTFYSSKFDELNFPNGENAKILDERVKKLIIELQKRFLHFDRIFAVGHGMFNRYLIYKICPGREDIWASRSYPHERIIYFGNSL